MNARKQHGFTLLEMLISTALVVIIALSVLQLMRFSDQHYETAQAIEQLNQKEMMVRDVLTAIIEKAGQNVMDETTAFAPTLPRDELPISGQDIIGEVLAVNYDHGNRCDGQALKSDSGTTDYFFISIDTTGEEVLSLRCEAPGQKIASLVANVEYMALRYHRAQANQANSLQQYDEDLLGTNADNWHDISRISVYVIIATDERYYENAPARQFSNNTNDFPSNEFDIDVNTAADGRYRRALYFVIEPTWLVYQTNE